MFALAAVTGNTSIHSKQDGLLFLATMETTCTLIPWLVACVKLE